MWKMTLFGLKYGQDLENRVAHPTKNSQEYPPGLWKQETICKVVKPNPFTKQGKASPCEVRDMIIWKMVRGFETIQKSK